MVHRRLGSRIPHQGIVDFYLNTGKSLLSQELLAKLLSVFAQIGKVNILLFIKDQRNTERARNFIHFSEAHRTH